MTSDNVTEAEPVEAVEPQPSKAVDDQLIDELVGRAQATVTAGPKAFVLAGVRLPGSRTSTIGAAQAQAITAAMRGVSCRNRRTSDAATRRPRIREPAPVPPLGGRPGITCAYAGTALSVSPSQNRPWRPTVPADVITMITNDHRELERMFGLMKEDRDSRPLTMPLAVAVLAAHSRAEEEHVYPVVAREAGEAGEARHSTGEHHQAEQLGRRLPGLNPEAKEFDQGLEEFTGAVLHHVQEEESDILPALREAVETDRLRQLGQAFAERRARELAGQRPTTGGAHGTTG